VRGVVLLVLIGAVFLLGVRVGFVLRGRNLASRKRER
jgi:hypothetical protein